jgi:hypothetical protein
MRTARRMACKSIVGHPARPFKPSLPENSRVSPAASGLQSCDKYQALSTPFNLDHGGHMAEIPGNGVWEAEVPGDCNPWERGGGMAEI